MIAATLCTDPACQGCSNPGCAGHVLPDLSKLTIEHGDSGFEYGEEKCVGEGGHFWVEDVVCGSVTWYSCERCSVPAWIDHSEATHAA